MNRLIVSAPQLHSGMHWLGQINDIQFNQRHALLIALHILCLLGSPEPIAPGHLSEPDRGGEEPGGEGGQPGAAGPGWEHSAPCGLPARTDRVHQRDDQRRFP